MIIPTPIVRFFQDDTHLIITVIVLLIIQVSFIFAYRIIRDKQHKSNGENRKVLLYTNLAMIAALSLIYYFHYTEIATEPIDGRDLKFTSLQEDIYDELHKRYGNHDYKYIADMEYVQSDLSNFKILGAYVCEKNQITLISEDTFNIFYNLVWIDEDGRPYYSGCKTIALSFKIDMYYETIGSNIVISKCDIHPLPVIYTDQSAREEIDQAVQSIDWNRFLDLEHGDFSLEISAESEEEIYSIIENYANSTYCDINVINEIGYNDDGILSGIYKINLFGEYKIYTTDESTLGFENILRGNASNDSSISSLVGLIVGIFEVNQLSQSVSDRINHQLSKEKNRKRRILKLIGIIILLFALFLILMMISIKILNTSSTAFLTKAIAQGTYTQKLLII